MEMEMEKRRPILSTIVGRGDHTPPSKEQLMQWKSASIPG